MNNNNTSASVVALQGHAVAAVAGVGFDVVAFDIGLVAPAAPVPDFVAVSADVGFAVVAVLDFVAVPADVGFAAVASLVPHVVPAFVV